MSPVYKLLIFAMATNILSNPAGTFPTDNFTSGGSLNVNKMSIDGEVTVFINAKSKSSMGFETKTLPRGFELREKEVTSPMGTGGTTYRSKVHNGTNDIRPFHTDSIIVNGITAYPAPDNANWLFPYYEGRITVHACHPNVPALLHYKESNGEFKKLPKRLLTSTDTISKFGLLSVEPTWIADSLSRFPLLFCMYKYDEMATIRQFNELDESKLLPVELSMEVTPQIYSIFTTKTKMLYIDSIQKVLDRAPTDMILNCKMAELKLLENDDLEGAKEHLEIAKRSSNSEEYLVYYVEGLVLQESGHYEEAVTAYYKSLQYSADYGGDEMKKFRKMLNKKISKAQKKV